MAEPLIFDQKGDMHAFIDASSDLDFSERIELASYAGDKVKADFVKSGRILDAMNVGVSAEFLENKPQNVRVAEAVGAMSCHGGN